MIAPLCAAPAINRKRDATGKVKKDAASGIADNDDGSASDDDNVVVVIKPKKKRIRDTPAGKSSF